MNLFLILGFCFLFFFLLGPVIEKAKVPWIFSALLVGAVLSISNPIPSLPETDSFNFMSDLGMYFLLFIIGLEIDLSEIKKLGRLIVKSMVLIISLETLFGTLFVHFVFGTEWIIAALVAMSFGTVGEAILIPILDEFKIIHTRLGQTIIGVATLDDVFELLALLWLSVLLGVEGDIHTSVSVELMAFVLIIVLTIGLFSIKRFIPTVKIPDYNGIVLCFTLIILFIYIGIGAKAGMEALAAIFAGLVTKYFLSQEQFSLLETHAKLLTYGFLAPIFFLKVGLELNMNYLMANIWLVVFITLLSNSAKMIGSYLSARKELGTQKSVLMGIALSVRFSTSIVIVTVLYQNNLIGDHLFSVLIASSIIFKFIIPPLFASLLVKWDVAFKPD